jgi:hypothetical protein
VAEEFATRLTRSLGAAGLPHYHRRTAADANGFMIAAVLSAVAGF